MTVWWNLAQWHIGPHRGSFVKITIFFKSNMATAAMLKITKIAISPQQFDQSVRNLVRWCKMGLLTSQTLQNWISKIQDGGQLPFWKQRGNWQDFNWHNASRGPSAIAELLVSVNFSMQFVWEMVNGILGHTQTYLQLTFSTLFTKRQQRCGLWLWFSYSNLFILLF